MILSLRWCVSFQMSIDEDQEDDEDTDGDDLEALIKNKEDN